MQNTMVVGGGGWTGWRIKQKNKVHENRGEKKKEKIASKLSKKRRLLGPLRLCSLEEKINLKG